MKIRQTKTTRERDKQQQQQQQTTTDNVMTINEVSFLVASANDNDTRSMNNADDAADVAAVADDHDQLDGLRLPQKCRRRKILYMIDLSTSHISKQKR